MCRSFHNDYNNKGTAPTWLGNGILGIVSGRSCRPPEALTISTDIMAPKKGILIIAHVILEC